jgi:molybdate transport system substrate-binding protein
VTALNRGAMPTRDLRAVRWHPAALVTVAIVTLLGVAGCGDTAQQAANASPREPSQSPENAGTTTSVVALSGDVTVFAAASLTESFQTLGDSFMQAHPDVTVRFNFAGSSALAQQIAAGAPADVFAAASPATMKTVVDAGGNAEKPRVFARNALEIAVPPGNPAGVKGLADLANPDLTIALCAAEVPCGAAAVKAFAAAGSTPAPDTLERDVRAALSKVQLGEVDAALVYRSDVIAAGTGVDGIELPATSEATNDYPITVLTDAPNSEAAQAFVDHVVSREGQQVLANAGFASP